MMHEAMKERVGIERANCASCAYRGSDDNGGSPEYSVSWAICEKFERYQYLKPFPFTTEQKCWEPDFWHSKFVHEIKTAEDAEINSALLNFVAARDSLTPPTEEDAI